MSDLGPPSLPQDPSLGRSALVTLWAVLVAVGGGYLCGLTIDRFGSLGAVLFLLLGSLAGFMGRKILVTSSKPAGWLLAVAVVIAGVVGETWWIHWNIVQGAESWRAALLVLPTFAREYYMPTAVATVLALFGASSAHRRMSR